MYDGHLESQKNPDRLKRSICVDRICAHSTFVYIYAGLRVLMIVAFITINSGLVPLMEGLCAQILCFRFEIIGGLRSHLLLFFFGRKNMTKEKAVSSRSHPAS